MKVTRWHRKRPQIFVRAAFFEGTALGSRPSRSDVSKMRLLFLGAARVQAIKIELAVCGARTRD